MLLQFLFAIMAVLGISIIFHLPVRCMPASVLLGAIGWVVLKAAENAGLSAVLATFLSALLIALLGDICSRVLKDATTLFIIPGIIPLVPGGGMYYTMLYFIQGDIASAGKCGTDTLMIAGAIAVALLTMASIIKILVNIYRKIKNRTKTTKGAA